MDSDVTQSGIKSPLFTNQVEIGRMLEQTVQIIHLFVRIVNKQ